MVSTLHDVARIAGVSIKTVSNVVNNYPHIRPATRERVEAAIAELHYQPNLTARSLRSGRTGAIGLALPELSLSYFAELADSVIQAAERRGLVVLIEQTNGDRERELQVLTSPRLKLTDGLLFSPLGMGNDDAVLLDVKYPLVLLGERIFNGPTDHVTMRNIEAAAAATEHLINRGRRRIAIVGAHENEVIGSAGLRLRGYQEALQANGIGFDPALVGYTTLWHRANGATCMRQLMDSGVEFDAVFGLNDTLALGAMRVLQEAGRRVPDDVAVIGFDNLDLGMFTDPALSSVHQSGYQMGARAARLLLERINGKKGRPQQIVLPTELKIRNSVAPPPDPQGG